MATNRTIHARLVERMPTPDWDRINSLEDLARAFADEFPDATFGDLERAYLELRDTKGTA